MCETCQWFGHWWMVPGCLHTLRTVLSWRHVPTDWKVVTETLVSCYWSGQVLELSWWLTARACARQQEKRVWLTVMTRLPERRCIVSQRCLTWTYKAIYWRQTFLFSALTAEKRDAVLFLGLLLLSKKWFQHIDRGGGGWQRAEVGHGSGGRWEKCYTRGHAAAAPCAQNIACQYCPCWPSLTQTQQRTYRHVSIFSVILFPYILERWPRVCTHHGPYMQQFFFFFVHWLHGLLRRKHRTKKEVALGDCTTLQMHMSCIFIKIMQMHNLISLVLFYIHFRLFSKLYDHYDWCQTQIKILLFCNGIHSLIYVFHFDPRMTFSDHMNI